MTCPSRAGPPSVWVVGGGRYGGSAGGAGADHRRAAGGRGGLGPRGLVGGAGLQGSWGDGGQTYYRWRQGLWWYAGRLGETAWGGWGAENARAGRAVAGLTVANQASGGSGRRGPCEPDACLGRQMCPHSLTELFVAHGSPARGQRTQGSPTGPCRDGLAAPVTRPLFTWPGSPRKGTATSEGFNGKLRDEPHGPRGLLHPQEAQAPIEGWRQNHTSPAPQTRSGNAHPHPEPPCPHPPTLRPPPPTSHNPKQQPHHSTYININPGTNTGGKTLSGYLMYRKVRDAEPPNKFLAYGFAEGDATGYTDTLVEADTAYAYHVVAVSLHGGEPAVVGNGGGHARPRTRTRPGTARCRWVNSPRMRDGSSSNDKSLDRANGEGITYQSTHRGIRG